MPNYPLYLGEEGTEQFTAETWVNGKQIGFQKIHDPFAHTVVKIGWRECLVGLFRGLKVEVGIRGSEGAQRAIMTLNPKVLEFETAQILEERRRNREAVEFGDWSGVQACTKRAAQ